MRKLDLAWAAGFVDGEGCISLHTVKAKSGPCYVLRLAVANTNFVMLEHLQRIFNMGNLIQRPPINTRCKLTGHWQVCSKQAEHVLRTLLPYLVGKQQEAKVGLHSRTLIQTHGTNRPNRHLPMLATLKRRLETLKGH